MIVKGEGPLDAKIVIVGEAPGREEENMGRPFVGGSGQLLNQCLSEAGIPRSRCYVTNIMEIRPVGNDFGCFYTDKKRSTPTTLLQEGIRRLESELNRLHPNVIVPLGDEPLRAITGLRGIGKWRGSVLSSRFGKVVPAYHPAAILREYTLRPLLQLDIKKAAKQSAFPDVRVPTTIFHIDPSFDKVMDFLRGIRPGMKVAFDIETVGDLIRCLGLATSRYEAICIPFMSSPYRFRPGTVPILTEGSMSQVSSHWSEAEEYVILQELDRVLGDPGIEKIAQNAPFDMSRLEKQFGLRVLGLTLDTMLGFHNLYAELPKGLDTLVSIYTDFPYYSDYDVASDYEVWKYNCYDCVGTWWCAECINKDMDEHGIGEFYRNHLQPAMLALTRAENRGIRVDEEQMRERKATLVKEIAYPHKKNGWDFTGTLTQTIRDLINWSEFCPNSSKQMMELFYERLKLPPILNHKTKQPTADKNARNVLAGRYPQHARLFQLLDEWSRKETLVSGFLNRQPRSNGRMYTHYNLAGTVTGRIASAEPLDEPGTNLTNIPRGEFRRIFLADKDDVLIKADLKSAEWMVVCWACPVPRYIEEYRKNPDWDIHRFAASRVYDIPQESVTKEQRSNGKNGVYGSSYGMQPQRAAQTWKVPIQVAAFVLERWHAATPEIKSLYWKKIQQAITTSRCVENLMGRKRMFFDRINFPPTELDQIFRDAYSHFAQSTVADLINRAFALMDHFFPESECKILLQVHDEIVGTCKREFVAKFVELFRSFMEYPLIVPGVETPLTIQAEVTVGPNWYDQVPLDKFLQPS